MKTVKNIEALLGFKIIIFWLKTLDFRKYYDGLLKLMTSKITRLKNICCIKC